MNLYPQDLGTKRQTMLICRRAWQPKLADDDLPTPRLGRLGRLWTRGAGVDMAMAAATLRVMRKPLLGMTGLAFVPVPMGVFLTGGLFANDMPFGALLALALTVFWLRLMLVTFPRLLFKKVHRRLHQNPLRATELAALLPEAGDELERSYLTLAMDVTRQEVAAQAEADLRPALRALGDAIDRLPATRVVSDSPDIMTEVLRRTAAEALTQAQAEPDRVVAASLVRRAEALQRRADATHRAGQMVRRFGALRQEMAAETEALRAGLAAYYTGANDIADLTQLAEDIRRVAAEASALTAARDEIDEYLAATPVPTPEPLAEIRLNPGRG